MKAGSPRAENHQKTAAIRSAIELNLFTTIGSGADTPAAIASATGAA
jgi:hypothetical protein